MLLIRREKNCVLMNSEGKFKGKKKKVTDTLGSHHGTKSNILLNISLRS